MSSSPSTRRCAWVAPLGIAILGLALLACPAGQLRAQVVQPVGTYQEIFVTHDSTAATSSSISTYNSFVAAQAAENSALPSATWTAVASTASNPAYLNATSGSYPVYNTAGQLVSISNTIYSGSLANPVAYDQFGGTTASSPWTGSNSNGTGTTGFTLGSADVTAGDPHSNTATWLNNFQGVASGGTPEPLYALSSPITNNSTVAGGGLSTIGGAGVTFSNVTQAGIFSSSVSYPNNPIDLENVLGTAAYNAINFQFPSSPVFPGVPITPSFQVWDLGFSGMSTGLSTVTLHFDASSLDPSQLANLGVEHYTGGSWQLPNTPILPSNPIFVLDLTADTISFETSGFSPFMLAEVPEPSTLALLGIGGLGLAAVPARRKLAALSMRRKQAAERSRGA